MRIDMKRAAEVNQRKGLTSRTLAATAWFVSCLIFAFFFVNWLFSSGTLNSAVVYGEFGIPDSVSMNVVRLAGVTLLFGVLQFTAIMFFALTNPQARVRSGRPTARAQSLDYYEQQYQGRA
ncbi:MAG TPA: hypothetical protein VLE70_02185 [Anaerolineae bacterium]|jgi:hypothetical protein|nr:hypothetical protein [Anaerolineae bacterium]